MSFAGRFPFALLAAAALGVSAIAASDGPVISYPANGIVNSADNLAVDLAPNVIASLYGLNLSYSTLGVSASDIHGGMLPTVLPSTGVQVIVNGELAPIFYVSPKQINFLIPSNLLPGPVYVQTTLDGRTGPKVTVILQESAPALYLLDQQTAVSIRGDGSVVNAGAPARPEDWVLLFATGLGDVIPPVASGEIPTAAARIVDMRDFQVLLDGAPVDAKQIGYAGVAPGFGGLYQINLKMPAGFAANPEIQIALGKRISPRGIHLPAQP